MCWAIPQTTIAFLPDASGDRLPLGGRLPAVQQKPNPLVDRADEIKMGRRLLCLPFPAESKNNRLRNSASRAEGFVGRCG